MHFSIPQSLFISHGLWTEYRLLQALSLFEKLRQFQGVHAMIGYPPKVEYLPAHHTKGPLEGGGGSQAEGETTRNGVSNSV